MFRPRPPVLCSNYPWSHSGCPWLETGTLVAACVGRKKDQRPAMFGCVVEARMASMPYFMATPARQKYFCSTPYLFHPSFGSILHRKKFTLHSLFFPFSLSLSPCLPCARSHFSFQHFSFSHYPHPLTSPATFFQLFVFALPFLRRFCARNQSPAMIRYQKR